MLSSVDVRSSETLAMGGIGFEFHRPTRSNFGGLKTKSISLELIINSPVQASDTSSHPNDLTTSRRVKIDLTKAPRTVKNSFWSMPGAFLLHKISPSKTSQTMLLWKTAQNPHPMNAFSGLSQAVNLAHGYESLSTTGKVSLMLS